MGHPKFLSQREAMAVDTLGYNNSFGGPSISQDWHPNFSISEAYGRFPQMSQASDNTLTAAPASPPHPGLQAKHASTPTVGAVGEGASRQAVPSSSSSSASSSGTRRFHCSHCTGTFSRAGDLRRHASKHEPGLQAWDCPTLGCHRKGAKAFSRKDKMLSHSRVCRAGARDGHSQN